MENLPHLAGQLPARYLPSLLSVSDVITALKISRTTFYRLVEAGDLKPVKLGRRAMIVASELALFIAALPRGAAL